MNQIVPYPAADADRNARAREVVAKLRERAGPAALPAPAAQAPAESIAATVAAAVESAVDGIRGYSDRAEFTADLDVAHVAADGAQTRARLSFRYGKARP